MGPYISFKHMQQFHLQNKFVLFTCNVPLSCPVGYVPWAKYTKQLALWSICVLPLPGFIQLIQSSENILDAGKGTNEGFRRSITELGIT